MDGFLGGLSAGNPAIVSDAPPAAVTRDSHDLLEKDADEAVDSALLTCDPVGIGLKFTEAFGDQVNPRTWPGLSVLQFPGTQPWRFRLAPFGAE